MEFRVAEYKDFQRIAQLHADNWKRFYRGILSSEFLDSEADQNRKVLWQTRLINPSFNEHVIIAEEGGLLCGFVCAYGNHDFERGTLIDNLHVDPNYQRRGIGMQLISELLPWIERYFSKGGIYLEVLDGNENAIHFYEALGGTKSGVGEWKSPDGSLVKEHVYVWDHVDKFKVTTKVN